MKSLYVNIIIVAIIVLIGVFIGVKYAGVFGVILGGGEAIRRKKKKAQKNIEEAGEDVEATEHDSDSALDMYDDFYSDDDSE